MKVLFISSYDVPGDRFNGYSLLNHSRHFDSRMLVYEKRSNHAKVSPFLEYAGLTRELSFKIQRRIDGILGAESSLLSTLQLLKSHPFFQWADIIHLQLTHALRFFNHSAISEIARSKKTLWTIHSCWPMTGGCDHPFKCEKWRSGCKGWCPHPRSRSPIGHLTPQILWQFKKNTFKSQDIALIAASSWMEHRISTSPFFAGKKIYRIPFGLELNIFSPGDKESAKKKLGIKGDHLTLMFRGGLLSQDKFKGLQYLLDALRKVNAELPISLLVVGESRDFSELGNRYPIVQITDPSVEQLILAYNAADLFLMPSLGESFGLMAVEAMSCGTPVVVFDGTALPETIGNGRGGIVVPARDTQALTAAIEFLCSNKELRLKLGEQARDFCEQEYGIDLHTKRLYDVYQSL